MIIGNTSLEWAKKAGLPYWYEAETTSTNEIAKQQALMEKESIRLYFTDFQTAGKGRGEHSWSSGAPGTSLLVSWSFQTKNSPQPVLSPLLGLAIYRAAVASFPHLPFSMKAPNDLYLDGQKLAGLLLENLTIGSKNRLIVGLGLNVFAAPDGMPNAVYLSKYVAELSSQDWGQFLDRLLLEITMAIAGASATLAPLTQQALLYALNLNPKLEKKYLRVSAHGDLHQEGGTLPWSQI